MNRCIGITKKGDRCKNMINVGKLCHLHKKQPISPIKVKIPTPISPIKVKIPTPISPIKVKIPTPIKPIKVKIPTLVKGKKGTKSVAQARVKTSTVVDKDLIYDPYYGKNVSQKDNCGLSRKSLERVPSTNLNKDFVSMFCDVLPLKNIVNVVGPIMYFELKYKTYNIGLFGEQHHIQSPPNLSQENTLNFSSFILSIITQNASTEYDFFLETRFRLPGHVYPGPYSRNTILNLLDTDFKGCFDIVKKCPYKNLRAHYTDYRSVSDLLTSDLYSIYNYIVYLPDNLPLKNGSFPSTLQMLIANPLKKYDEVVAYVDNLIHTDKKILKQLDSIPVDIKKSILEFYNLIIKTRTRNAFQTFIKKSKLDDISFFNPTFNDATILMEFITYYMMVYAALMDVYTLARMFKVYDPTKPKNIIVYAGDGHINVYLPFLFAFLKDSKIVIRKVGPNYITFSEDDKKKSFLFT